MIRISQLVCGRGTVSEALKHRSKPVEEIPSGFIAFSEIKRPVVFWNVTRKCNLRCIHCYISASPSPATATSVSAAGKSGTAAEAGKEVEEELSTEEAKVFIEDLAAMRIPLLMFTGGEPLVRKDFFEIAEYANALRLKTALSTNGTLISESVASRLRDCGIEYVGISLDGASEQTHDEFRAQRGSFKKALQGLKNCVKAGLKTGIRFTVTRFNYKELPALIELALSLKVPRFCVYWLVPSGRGSEIYEQQLKHSEVREILNFLYRKALELSGKMEILTVDAPQDAVFFLQKLKEDGLNEAYESGLKLLEFMGDACSAGERVANVDPAGNIYPCQFAQMPALKVGNVRERKFSEIWNDPKNEILRAFREKQKHLKGACRTCEFKQICGGGCRIRALSAFGDIWAEDPLCPLAEQTNAKSF